MPLFLWFYLAGLSLAFGVGLVWYFGVGGHALPLMRSLFGERSGPLWTRSFRMMLVVCAVIGGMTVQWYGCDGYTDYDRVAEDRQVMVEKTTEQTAAAMRFVSRFAMFAVLVGGIAFAFLHRGAAANVTDPSHDSIGHSPDEAERTR